MSNLLFKLAEKFTIKYGNIEETQLSYARFAPASLQWNKDQILELQKLLNLAISAWSPNVQKLQEDGIYGPKTREILGGMMKGINVTDPAGLVSQLRQKFPNESDAEWLMAVKNMPQYLINAVGKPVTNAQDIKKVQQALLNKGQRSESGIDGKWGRQTFSMLWSFQKKNNLPATGTLNQQTVAALGLL